MSRHAGTQVERGIPEAGEARPQGQPRRAGGLPGIQIGLALVPLFAGCGGLRFHRAWSEPVPDAGAWGMAGRWKGEWRSEWNGHSGGLRCRMTRVEEWCYRAWFLSTYARILSFQHETTFQITSAEDGTLRFEGEQDLGAMVGGLYRYEGTVSGDFFRATFQAENGDHGVFEMRRVD